jgi:GT2 family glycosyltransferase
LTPENHAPKVGVVVLNWNGKEDTLACLESLASVTYPAFEIYVVDNGYSDGSVPVVRSRFPNSTVIENGRNLGFAGGNNVGIRYALERGADYVLILNNDTLVAPDLLDRMMGAALRESDVGVVGAKI